jgi:hypothetical protein
MPITPPRGAEAAAPEYDHQSAEPIAVGIVAASRIPATISSTIRAAVWSAMESRARRQDRVYDQPTRLGSDL